MAMEPQELRAALEAILFVSTEPVRVDDLADAFSDAGREALVEQLDAIKASFDANVGGFMLEQTAGGWRLATRAEHDPVLKKYFARKGENRLSIAALQTLAIIAYRQPITAPEISEIRGVNATGTIRTLLERHMARVAGRKNVVGSPFLYRTTREFLVHFGLNDIRDLPRLEEFGDLIGENMNDDLLAAISSAEPASPSEFQEITDTNELERADAEALAELARADAAAEERERRASEAAEEEADEDEAGEPHLDHVSESRDEHLEADDAIDHGAREDANDDEHEAQSSNDEVESSGGNHRD